jgi:transcriptional regulator with XRE-family HTH domain
VSCDHVFVIKAADLLRSARRRALLTQRALARRARIPQPTIAAIEAGRQDPRYRTLARLLAACSVELDFVPTVGRGIDRTLIRELLRLTPTARAMRAVEAARAVGACRAARRRS